MASVTDTVRAMIWNHPTVCPNRAAALAQLFLTCGNGYVWSGGELVSRYPEEPAAAEDGIQDEDTAMALWALDYVALLPDHEREIHIAKRRLAIRRENAAIRFARENADLLALEPGTLAKPVWLPDEVPLTAVPDNVRPDWLAAAREAATMVFETRPAPGDDRQARYHKAAVAVADKALRDLARRFGADGAPASHADWLARHAHSRRMLNRIIDHVLDERPNDPAEVRTATLDALIDELFPSEKEGL